MKDKDKHIEEEKIFTRKEAKVILEFIQDDLDKIHKKLDLIEKQLNIIFNYR